MATYLIPDGTYKFQNVQYPDYVADLINAVPQGPISGYQENPSNTNDKWIVRNQGTSGNQITLESVSVPQSYAGRSGDFRTVVGSTSLPPTVWTVIKVDDGNFAISPNDALVWVLPKGESYTQIILDAPTGQGDAKWTPIKVGSGAA